MSDSSDDFEALFEQLAAEAKAKKAEAKRDAENVVAKAEAKPEKKAAKPAAKRSSKRASAAPATATAPDAGLVKLDSELTFDRVAQVKIVLQQALAAAQAESLPLRLDLSAVAECDGAGLQMLLAAARAARRGDGRLELQGTPARMLEQLERFGVTSHFITQ